MGKTKIGNLANVFNTERLPPKASRQSLERSSSELEGEHYHPATVAALHPRNYRDGLERVARYKQLCCPEEVSITTNGTKCVIETCWLYSDGDEPSLLTDAVFASFVELGRRGTQPLIRPQPSGIETRP